MELGNLADSEELQQSIKHDIAREELSTIWTPEEEAVYDSLSEAYNRMIQLEELHPVDRKEFAHHINILKNIIMSRPVAKLLRRLYQNEEGRGGYTKITEV